MIRLFRGFKSNRDTTTGVLIVAKAKKSAGRPPMPSKDAARETVIHMKGSPEYVKWLEAVHKDTSIPKVQIFRLALIEWAANRKLPRPPEI